MTEDGEVRRLRARPLRTPHRSHAQVDTSRIDVETAAAEILQALDGR